MDFVKSKNKIKIELNSETKSEMLDHEQFVFMTLFK